MGVSRYGWLRTLARLEWLRARAFWRYAARDIVFDLCVAAGVAMLYAAARRGVVLAHGAPAAMQLSLAFGLGLLFLLSAWAGPGSRARERLISGPFHALVSDPADMALWMSLRALATALIACLAASAVVATIDLAGSAEFLGLSWSGAAVGAGLLALRRDRRAGETGAAAPRRVRRLIVRGPALLIALSALRQRGLAAGALLALGCVAAGLAARNNDAPQIGVAVCAIAGILSALALFPHGRLPGLLGQQPPRLPVLFAWLFAAPMAMALVAAPLAALAAGLGPAGAVQVGASAGAGVGIVAWFYFLHRLIRSQRFSGLSTGLEFAAALFMAVIEASLGPLWLAARSLILVRAASRRRWLER